MKMTKQIIRIIKIGALYGHTLKKSQMIMVQNGRGVNIAATLNTKWTPYSDEIFREKLAIWITIDDQPFTVTECQEFKELVKVCNEKAELPSADTVRRDVLKLYNKYRIDVKHMLQNVLGKLSFTLDCWTSTNNIAFLGITCHFVDVDWCLKETLVDFIHLSGSHSGENLAKEFLKSIDEDFNILTKEILKNIKAGDAQEEDELLELVSQEEQEDNVNVEIIPKLRRLITSRQDGIQRILC
ncbi:unnamed protein product [Rhizophagus irregularis]|uniref:Uncharacterized protein n=1 Tax=Rhizophagus irregularis TaxID=588596 RepID=A0A916EFR8_9GLOM|nr:unnamed protein product [Rhizophagus irregularis]